MKAYLNILQGACYATFIIRKCQVFEAFEERIAIIFCAFSQRTQDVN